MKKFIKMILYHIFDFLCEMFTDWDDEGFKSTFLGWVFYNLKQKCT